MTLDASIPAAFKLKIVFSFATQQYPWLDRSSQKQQYMLLTSLMTDRALVDNGVPKTNKKKIRKNKKSSKVQNK